MFQDSLRKYLIAGNMYSVSVIIPCYNAENFLVDCLKGLSKQTFRDFEIIFVDDGSTDYTPKMLDEYASSNSNVKVIHQANQGVSTAKNNGFKIASGKYIYFCDSDDFIHPQLLEIFYNTLEKNNSDIVGCGSNFFKEQIRYDDVQFEDLTNKNFISNYDDLDVIFSKMLVSRPSSFFTLGVNKMFRKELLSKIDTYPILFNNKISYGEDTNMLCKYLLNVKKVSVVNKKLHYYRQRKGSVLHSKFKENLITVLKSTEPLDLLDKTKFKLTDIHRKSLQAIFAVEMIHRIRKSDFNDKEKCNYVYNEFKNNLKYTFLAKYNVWYIKYMFWVSRPFIYLAFKSKL